ncbi:uncharacterized protein PFL1_03999 [Pseudozyma flocculosa PF-1]|uniref:FAD dependent oxidoreductase domain-containing protein n=1 Tax=Pseudozyma flocculosa PF-1 TaxID=1277687 RepID=A0A061HDJ0_9BASI|nr:uncharacterized protein PFL1_03999 [Pseudozyma flocculosa PF-1]EPQ28696.1 hypothetical protein PFL1_03999 [Pseudozyma flocculosa PF-1]
MSAPHDASPSAARSLLFVGGGVFGSSCALAALEAGYSDVTILERSTDGRLAPDAASNDLNKAVRSDYSDPCMHHLASMALDEWNHNPLYSPHFSNTGVVVSCNTTDPQSKAASFVSKGFDVAKRSGQQVRWLHTTQDVVDVVGTRRRQGDFAKRPIGYHNPSGGWANSGAAVNAVLDRVRCLGGKVIGAAEVVKIEWCTDAGASGHLVAKGVVTSSGASYAADEITVALIRVPPSVKAVYRGAPVMVDASSGFYCFEPNDEGVFKMATHSSGYLHRRPDGGGAGGQDEGCSVPLDQRGCWDLPSHLVRDEGRYGRAIPREAVQTLRRELARFWPELAALPFTATRLCWYGDALSGTWLMDRVPGVSNLSVLGGDGGHLFKFLPVIGKVALECLGLRPARTRAAASRRGVLDSLPLALEQRREYLRGWTWAYHVWADANFDPQRFDPFREVATRQLDSVQEATPQDLLPHSKGPAAARL